MSKVQIITDKEKPKFVVLPFGDLEALEDYREELWALEVVRKYDAKKNKKLIPHAQVMAKLGIKSKTSVKKNKVSRRG